jgi:hypothetical protein
VNAFDYYQNPKITNSINGLTKRIISLQDREDCQQEIWAELYDFMPLDDEGAIKIIERVAKKFKRNRHDIYENEISYAEAGIQ